MTIKGDTHNANKGTKRGRAMVKASLAETGAGRSVLLDKHGNLIAGNKTYGAAQDLGLPIEVIQTDGSKLVAVQRMDLDLDDPTGKARRLAYYDNQSSSIGLAWDPDVVLPDVMAGLDFKGIFEQDELAKLIAGALPADPKPSPEMDVNRADELREKYGVAPGQIWQLGKHRVACGDATDRALVAMLLGDVRPGLMHGDPPYGIDLIGKKTRHLGKSKGYDPVEGDDKPFDPAPVLSYSETNLLWGANHYADKLPASPFWLVWDKQGGAKDIDHASCELAWCSDKQPARCITHVWDGFRRDSEKGVERYHPNQKPIAVVKWALGWVKADAVLDLYAGTGPALLACDELGRQCFAVEKVPNYVAVIIDRWVQATGGTPELCG